MANTHYIEHSNLVLTDSGPRLGNDLSGKLTGYFDLGAKGPWNVRFKVKPSRVDGANIHDYITMAFNGGHASRHYNTPEKNSTVTFTDNSGHLAYDMTWQSNTDEGSKHLQVLDAVATCGACSHVSCKLEMHTVYKTKRVAVRYNRLETRGRHHRCAMDRGGKSCTCACSDTAFEV